MDEFTSEPVEQLGMRGAAAIETEVVRGVHNADAEVIVPEPIGNHPRGKRIARIADPCRKLEPALGLRRVRREAKVRIESFFPLYLGGRKLHLYGWPAGGGLKSFSPLPPGQRGRG